MKNYKQQIKEYKEEIEEKYVRAEAENKTIEVKNGKGSVSGVKTGLYLVYTKPVNSAQYGYSFVPYLVSAPNNEFAMTGSGSDSWIYDNINCYRTIFICFNMCPCKYTATRQ